MKLLFNLKKFSILSILIFSVSCSKSKSKVLGEDDKLSIVKENYLGKELKLEGYYYFQVGTNIFDSYIFYRNGVIINGGGAGDNPNTLTYLENNFQSSTYNEYIKKRKSAWGLFKIDRNKISIEHWYSGEGNLKSYLSTGIILNETTFKITATNRSDGTERVDKEEIYKFKNFSPKPDSTNQFVN